MTKSTAPQWSPNAGMRGFTLIELMVVVAVIAILAAIAYPSYQDAVRKSKRAQAKADLVELAQRFERWHTVNNSYENFWNTTNVPADQRVSPKGSGSVYDLSASGIAPNTFLLTATPRSGTQQTRDTLCMTLTLNQAGVRTKSGSGNLSDCW